MRRTVRSDEKRKQHVGERRHESVLPSGPRYLGRGHAASWEQTRRFACSTGKQLEGVISHECSRSLTLLGAGHKRLENTQPMCVRREQHTEGQDWSRLPLFLTLLSAASPRPGPGNGHGAPCAVSGSNRKRRPVEGAFYSPDGQAGPSALSRLVVPAAPQLLSRTPAS